MGEGDNNWDDGFSKPSFKVTTGVALDAVDYKHKDSDKNDIDLDELKAFLDEGIIAPSNKNT